MEEDLKPIIVNGVDVSKCEFLTKTGHCKAHMSIMGIDTNKCECFPNCYYKQLKRKEQECEELKEWQKANQPTGICETCTAKSIEDMYKYKQALNEIEKFCKDVCDSCKKFTPNRQSDISCGLCQVTQILNIINKVRRSK